MRTAAWLQVHITDRNEPDLARARRWFNGHCPHKLRLHGQLLVRNPLYRDRQILPDELVQLFRQRLLVQSRIWNIEIEPAIAFTNRATRHRVGQ